MNDYMPSHSVNRLILALNFFERPLRNSRIVVLGYTYKPNVRDHRETPVQEVIRQLVEGGAQVIVVDRHTDTIQPFHDHPSVTLARAVLPAAEGADALMLLTAHPEFLDLDQDLVGSKMNLKVLVDGRRVFDRHEWQRSGFYVAAIGAPDLEPLKDDV